MSGSWRLAGGPAPSGCGGPQLAAGPGARSARPLSAAPPAPPRRPLSEARCMLSSCRRRLLHVLVPSFPPLTRGLRLCPGHLMKPLVVFVLGGPGAGKGTQCARIVEVRPCGRATESFGAERARASGSCRVGCRAPRRGQRTTNPDGHRAPGLRGVESAGARRVVRFVPARPCFHSRDRALLSSLSPGLSVLG